MSRHSVRAVGIAVVVSLAVGLLVSWFAWPARELAPRDLPVIVAGPAPAAGAFADQLRQARPGAFDVSLATDADAADTALRAREAYAAFVIGPSGIGPGGIGSGGIGSGGIGSGGIGSGGLSLHTASGASPAVATLLTSAVWELGGGRPVTTVDVVRGSPADPRGVGFASGFLPLVLAGMLAGILLALLVSSKRDRLVGLAAVAVLAGAVGAGVLHGLDLLTGSYVAAAGALGLLILAISTTVAGLASVLGLPGIGLGALVVFLFGNPISAVAAAPELLPQPWGAVGQFLPPGAGATLLRSAAFFDSAGSAAALWTLVAWSVAGLALLVLGRARTEAVPRP